LVIEICVTRHEFDRSRLAAYARAGVKECWLVLGPEKLIEVYLHPVDGRFSEKRTHGPGGQLTSSAVPEISLALNTLFSK